MQETTSSVHTDGAQAYTHTHTHTHTHSRCQRSYSCSPMHAHARAFAHANACVLDSRLSLALLPAHLINHQAQRPPRLFVPALTSPTPLLLPKTHPSFPAFGQRRHRALLPAAPHAHQPRSPATAHHRRPSSASPLLQRPCHLLPPPAATVRPAPPAGAQPLLTQPATARPLWTSFDLHLAALQRGAAQGQRPQARAGGCRHLRLPVQHSARAGPGRRGHYGADALQVGRHSRHGDVRAAHGQQL